MLNNKRWKLGEEKGAIDDKTVIGARVIPFFTASDISSTAHTVSVHGDEGRCCPLLVYYDVYGVYAIE
jgi:hypothetical protein